MRALDIIGMCLRNLFRRKFRTFLTVSGVVIGTCAIIVMISLGIAISASQDEMMTSYGDLTVIDVYGWDPQNPLNDESLASILQLEGVDVVTPFLYYYEAESINIVGGNKDRYSMRVQYEMSAVYPDALEKLGYRVQEGTFLPSTNSSKKIQVLVGEQMAYQFEDTKKSWQNNRVYPYPDEFGNIAPPFLDPMKDPLRLVLPMEKTKLEYEVEVVGVMVGDPTKNWATMNGLFISIGDMNRIRADYEKLAGKTKSNSNGRNASVYTGYNNVIVKAVHIDMVTKVEAAIHELGFTETYSRESERQQMQKSAARVQMILGGLGAISLFVAAISITNTMIMSVYERTREIGVMKVLGCLVGNIRTIFLMEAGLIGFMGGVFGVAISYLLSFLLNTFGNAMGGDGILGGLIGGMFFGGSGARISIIPPWLVLLGMTFATLIGLASGFYPANRAVKIGALEAIKQE